MGQFVNKISIATVCGDWSHGWNKRPIKLMAVDGIINSYETGQVMRGKEVTEYIRFNGTFVAINIQNNQPCGPARSLFLPDSVAETIQMAANKKPGIRIRVGISAEPSSGPKGYRYTVHSLPGDETYSACADEAVKELMQSVYESLPQTSAAPESNEDVPQLEDVV